MACGFHQLDTADLKSLSSGPIFIAPPRDLADLGERIYTFWSVFSFDALGEIIFGMPSSIPDDEEVHAFYPWPF